MLTDGKIGDDVHCLAVARALSENFSKRVVAPHAFFAAFAPWGPIDPKDAPTRAESPIAKPFPDIVVASGRRAIPYARAVKRASRGAAKVVIMKNPRAGAIDADVVWAPRHDCLSGARVIATLTAPHEMTARIAEARAQGAQLFEECGPVLGVVLGGPSGRVKYEDHVTRDLAAKIAGAARDYAGVAVTVSRRTPRSMAYTIRSAAGPKLLKNENGAEVSYTDILAHSDALIVTADSHNMMSEAASAGVGVYAFRPPGLASKLAWFADEMEKTGVVRPFAGAAPAFEASPIDASAEIVAEIKRRLGQTAPG